MIVENQFVNAPRAHRIAGDGPPCNSTRTDRPLRTALPFCRGVKEWLVQSRSLWRPILLLALFVYPGRSQASTEEIFIHEYQVKGAHQLTRIEIEEAVYPYLGPGRTKEDVEKARAALEKAYQDKGYQTVSVQVPRP